MDKQALMDAVANNDDSALEELLDAALSRVEERKSRQRQEQTNREYRQQLLNSMTEQQKNAASQAIVETLSQQVVEYARQTYGDDVVRQLANADYSSDSYSVSHARYLKDCEELAKANGWTGNTNTSQAGAANWDSEEAMSEALFGRDSQMDPAVAARLAGEWYSKKIHRVHRPRTGAF